MSTACVPSEYFSGQGALLLAERDISGNAIGLRPVGNVSALTIAHDVTEFTHKESCTGTRGIDLKLSQETNATLTFTMESIDSENLVVATYGSLDAIASGSAVAEPVKGYIGLWTSLPHIQIADFVLSTTAVTPVVLTLGTDYEVNLAAGTFRALTGGAITDAQELAADYDYATQDRVNALTTSSGKELWARFEGVNTARNNEPVVVDFYRVQATPLAELALINEEIAGMEIVCQILLDTTKPVGKQYYDIKKLAS